MLDFIYLFSIKSPEVNEELIHKYSLFEKYNKKEHIN